MGMKPAWLERLMGEKFFGGCGTHESRRKNEKNVFCLDCCRSICPHCVPSHRSQSHPLLQVRRYVYHDVVRLDDLEKLIDCSYVQPYTINSAKVVFLNQRPQSRPCKGSATNICFTCDRILQEPFRFCSLSCKSDTDDLALCTAFGCICRYHIANTSNYQKVDHVLLQGGGDLLSSILYRFDESDFAFSQFEGLRMDGSDVTEEDVDDIDDNDNHHQMNITSTAAGANSSSHHHHHHYSCSSSSSEVVARSRSSRKGSGFLPEGIVHLSLSSRRKGAPHRSPLS